MVDEVGITLTLLFHAVGDLDVGQAVLVWVGLRSSSELFSDNVVIKSQSVVFHGITGRWKIFIQVGDNLFTLLARQDLI